MPLSSRPLRRPAGEEQKGHKGRVREPSLAGPLNDSLLSEAPYAGSCLPIGEFFQRVLAAQIGTIQLSSSSAGLHTPLDMGATSLLWVPGRGEGGPQGGG